MWVRRTIEECCPLFGFNGKSQASPLMEAASAVRQDGKVPALPVWL